MEWGSAVGGSLEITPRGRGKVLRALAKHSSSLAVPYAFPSPLKSPQLLLTSVAILSLKNLWKSRPQTATAVSTDTERGRQALDSGTWWD